jgi:hypothetical protein
VAVEPDSLLTLAAAAEAVERGGKLRRQRREAMPPWAWKASFSTGILLLRPEARRLALRLLFLCVWRIDYFTGELRIL